MLKNTAGAYDDSVAGFCVQHGIVGNYAARQFKVVLHIQILVLVIQGQIQSRVLKFSVRLERFFVDSSKT